jgi:uncharacterized protein (DUF2141 family)
MRLFAPVAIAFAMAASAQAQTIAPGTEFQPIPNTIPGLLIAPAPLSGTLLQPLHQNGTGTVPIEAAEVAPGAAVAEPVEAAAPAAAEPAAIPAAEVATGALPEEAPEASPEPAAPTAAEPAPEPPGESVATPEPEPEPEPAVPAAPVAPAGTTITVIVEGVETNQGVVNVAVCDRDLSEEGCPYSKEVTAKAGFVETRFDGLPPGVYAVVGYHDENGNNEFDKFLGVPREPYALSNRAGEKMVPTFRDAALKVNEGDNTVIIRLQRLLGG